MRDFWLGGETQFCLSPVRPTSDPLLAQGRHQSGPGRDKRNIPASVAGRETITTRVVVGALIAFDLRKRNNVSALELVS